MPFFRSKVKGSSNPPASAAVREIGFQNDSIRFGSYQIQGKFKSQQEDTLLGEKIDVGTILELPPEARKQEVAYRVWTAIRHLNAMVFRDPSYDSQGSTLTSVIWDGKHLTTATLGDSAAFAIVCNEEGRAVQVRRLNSQIHHTSNHAERLRLLRLGRVGYCRDEPRVNGRLLVTRSIGDKEIFDGEDLLNANAQVDIISIETLLQGQNPRTTIKILVASDGLTDMLGSTKELQNKNLLGLYNSVECPETESGLARLLATRARAQHSYDDISIGIHTLGETSCLIGVCDGHSGDTVSKFVAREFPKIVQKLLMATLDEYSNDPFCVYKLKDAFYKDHSDKQELYNALYSKMKPEAFYRSIALSYAITDEIAGPASFAAPESSSAEPRSPAPMTELISIESTREDVNPHSPRSINSSPSLSNSFLVRDGRGRLCPARGSQISLELESMASPLGFSQTR